MDLPFDQFLLDRVFQPIADRLAHRTTCYALARLLLHGVLVLVLAVIGGEWREGRLDGWNVLFGPCMFYIAWANLLLLRRAESRAERQDGTAGGLRLRIWWQRLYWVVMTAISLYRIGIGYREFSDVAGLLLDLCLAGAVYFMSCRANPPARRTHFAWATVRAGA
ncbi:MAG: hypothetical protein JO209_07185 [Acidisphaera sp.]|nr:hypothetical protein [Acidisphaera sp.]